METSKLSFWKIFAITLLISNTVILAFIFFEKSTSADNKGPANFIIKELNLKESEQVCTFDFFFKKSSSSESQIETAVVQVSWVQAWAN